MDARRGPNKEEHLLLYSHHGESSESMEMTMVGIECNGATFLRNFKKVHISFKGNKICKL